MISSSIVKKDKNNSCGNMHIVDRAIRIKQILTQQLNTKNRLLLKEIPLDAYCGYLKDCPTVCSYKFINDNAKSLYEKLISRGDNATVELYHKIVVLHLLIESSTSFKILNYSKDIQEWHWITFKSVLEKIEKNRIFRGAYLFPHDRLYKDLGICTLKLIPVGVRKLHLEKLPLKRFLFKRGLYQFVRVIYCIIFELKGIQPVFHGHLDFRDRQSIAEFSPEGWMRHFKMVADLLKVKTSVKGVMGLAWFYDPNLKQISPELAYLRELVVDNGGKFFFVGTNEIAIENAIRMSPKRRKLYQCGEYLPTNYLYIWPRKSVIQWAEKV